MSQFPSFHEILRSLTKKEIRQQSIPRSLYESFDIRKWSFYLQRKPTRDEERILHNVSSEKHMNEMLHELYKKCKTENLYVPRLTNLIGDCMFESLLYHKIGEDVESLRKGLAIILNIFKDKKDFLPNGLTFSEMFFNEIEFVGCWQNDVQKFYKYTYNIMCQDLSNKHSWSRLPAEFILRVISFLYKLKIVIVMGSSETNPVINSYENVEDPPELETIHLGLLDEFHYVPVNVLDDNESSEELVYVEAYTEFIKWAQGVQKQKIIDYYDEKMFYQKYSHYNFNYYDGIDEIPKSEHVYEDIKTADPSNDVTF